MNNLQVQAILAPVIGAIATYLATRFPLLDPPTWNTLVSAVIFSGVAAFMATITSKKPLANTLANYTDTTVVTDKQTADALPKNDSVIANTEVKVVSK